MHVKISVVVSTYNGEKYIIEQIDSIRNQTRVADEVLFFDDCSSDNTVLVIKEFIERYHLENWHIFTNNENKGWRKNFMDGLWQSRGDLIFPCDQDDIWMPGKLQIMEKIMSENPVINVLTTNCEAFYASGKIVIRPDAENRQLKKQPMVQNIFSTKYPGCTYCIRKSFMEICKDYWEADFPHDALFWRMGMFSETLYSYNECLIRWRRHNDSAYTIESMQFKTASKKRQWIEYAIRTVNGLKRFIVNADCPDKVNAERILDNVMHWLKHRAAFYDTKSITKGIQLLKYRKCYDRIRQYIGDWYIVYIRKT